MRIYLGGSMSLFLLENISFKNIKYPHIKIESKEVTFICGESGTGKSTMLRLLNGVISPDSGMIRYLNKPLEYSNSIELRKEVILVGQTVYLFDSTIKQNIYTYYEYRSLPKPADSDIKKFLTVCCIDIDLETLCTTMSGGERQRVYIAICLSLLPKTIMLDEPTSALDEHNSNQLMSNIIEFCKENDLSLIVISHNKALANKYADRLINLSREEI